MQEDIENRAVALAIKSVKLTGHGLKVAIAKYLAHRKEQKLHTAPTGRQTGISSPFSGWPANTA